MGGLMRKVILYIAISLDGKIARANGSVDWLEKVPNPDQSDFGFFDFIKGIDTVLMGNKTYQQVLGFDVPYPYTDQTSYIFTRNTALDKDENATFISGNIGEFVRDLKKQDGKDIWLIGGGEIIYQLLEEGLVDEAIVHVMPIMLGNGIPLVSKELPDRFLTLLESKTYPGGAVELRYGMG